MFLKYGSVKKLVLVFAVVTLFAIPLAGVAAAADPVNGITTPADGDKVSGVVEVKGYASDPNFSRWQLNLLPGGLEDDAKAIYLVGSTASGPFTYSLNAASLPLGDHALRLRVVKNDGNYSEYVNKITVVEPVAARLGKLATAAAAAAGSAATAAKSAVAAAAPQVKSAVESLTNGITLPADMNAVAGQLNLKGYADDLKFSRWQLDLLPNGDELKAIPLKVGDKAGEFAYSLNTKSLPAGEHVLRLRVVRPDGNYTETFTKISVDASGVVSAVKEQAPAVKSAVASAVTAATQAATAAAPKIQAAAQTAATTAAQAAATSAAAMVNGLQLPAKLDQLTNTIDVKGYAAGDKFNRWQLDILANGDENKAIPLKVGTTPGEFAYKLDLAALPAGEHVLRLRVVKPDGNYEESLTKLPAIAAVTGDVSYMQRIALAPDSVVKVQLQDVSRADAKAQVIGEQSITTNGKQVPIAYSVYYNPTTIVPNHRYVVRAQIFDGAGKMLFTSDTAIPVITGGNPTSGVQVMVVPVK